MKQGEKTSEDQFLDSKLFNQALSKPTSHYIQSKLLSFPTKQAQDLKKLDLRHMCDTVVQQLEVVEKEAAYDYIKVSEELEQLGGELSLADGIMGDLENVLFDFKNHLESIKNQMTSLQEKSNQMNTSLSNRKKLQNMLNSFIDSAVLDKQLIDAICLGDINDDYVIHIKTLIKKLSYLNNNLIAPDSKAVKQLQPQLEKLKARASIRLREFLIEQITLLKKPKANINIIQKNVLTKYKVFTEFFKDHFPSIFTEICNAYRQTMAKIYMNNYKTYLQQIYKLQIQLYVKSDQLFPMDPQSIRSFLQQTKPTSLNQGSKTIFTLMNREKSVEQSDQTDVILYNATTVKNQRFSMEQIFKSVNKVLMDGVLNQIIFTAEFFNIKSEGASDLFGPIFRPSLNLFYDHIKTTMLSTYDLYGLLLILAINDKNKTSFREKQFKTLDYYFDQMAMLVWPKFQQLFDFHMKGLQAMNTRQYRILEKATSSKILINRFSDFMIGLYRLYEYFPDTKMMGIRIQNFRKTFFELQKKLKTENERESDGLNQYLTFLEDFHSSLISESSCKSKQFQDEQIRLQKQIGSISDKIVTSYIHDFIPTLDHFIKKYCKEEQGMNQQGMFQISQNIDQKALDSLVTDLSGQPLVSSLQKLVSFCEKKYSGYSLKSLLKKFLSVFMKYYTQIYKHIKNNHPESSSMMLQPHNAMKQIKTVFGKHIS